MSQWTHVNLVAELRFHECTSRTELKEQVEEALGDVGEYITGSEGGVDWYINVPKDHNSASWEQGEDTYYWDTVYLTCAGHLRDRTKEQTEQEIKDFVEYKLARDFSEIRNLTYKVYADGEELCRFREEENGR
jgi:hypothetical protein